MSLIKEGLFIGTRTDANNLAKAKLPAEKLRILTVDIEPLQLEEDGILSKHVPCMDEPEADLLSFFDECSEFITSGLKDEQNVIVHCLAGVSRSATVVLAYLMNSNQMSLDDAIGFLKSVYPKANPNFGFLEQLQLYEAMGNRVDKTNPVYKQYRLQLLASQIQSQQFVTKDLLSSLIEELKDSSATSHKKYQCRKCRLVLFGGDSCIEHEAGSGQASFKRHKQDSSAVKYDNSCTSLFIEPVGWMLPLLEGATEGKLPCPKCNGRLGSFNWAGMECSCGKWVTPAFQIHKNRIDESRSAHLLLNKQPTQPS
ncbi:hypothetical protein ACROYT_G002948 [Oculina patagonica]